MREHSPEVVCADGTSGGRCGFGARWCLALQNLVQPFLDIVKDVYKRLPETTRTVFKPTTDAVAAGKTTVAESSPNTLAHSLESFKVLTECPIIVVLLFNLHRNQISENVKEFVPLIIRALGLQAPPEARQLQRQKYTDFVAALVKVRMTGGARFMGAQSAC